MKLHHRWHAWTEHLRFRYLPSVVDYLVHLSTYQARVKLKGAPLTVLVDTNVIAHGVTHETQWVSTGYSSLWNIPLGYAARVPVHAPTSTSPEYLSVRYLPGIAHLANRRFLLLKTSAELQVEEGRLSAARLNGGDVFDYSVFDRVERERMDSLPPGTYDYSDVFGAKQQRARLNASNDPLYRALLDCLGQKNSQDAWHIRTAEAHGCFCFLTMDFTLLRTVAPHQHREPFSSLKTRLMTPQTLGEYLALTPIPTKFFSYHRASFPVRPDLHQPGSERIKRQKKRSPSS